MKGIGRWSAEVYLLFAEGRPDMWPAGDLAVQASVGAMLGLEQRPTERALRELGRTLAAAPGRDGDPGLAPVQLGRSGAVTLRVERADLDHPAVRSLLEAHHRALVAGSPPGRAFVLDPAALAAPELEVLAAWSGAALAGVGAVRWHEDGRAEVKSMRTHPDHLRRGVAAALLHHLVERARERGCAVVSLETGSGRAFAAAEALYRAHGFVEGEAVGGYDPSAFNRFFHRALSHSIRG